MFKHVHVQSVWMKTSLLIFTEVNEQPRLFNAKIQIQSCRVPQEAASCNRPPAGSTKVSQSVFLINKTKRELKSAILDHTGVIIYKNHCSAKMHLHLSL